MRKMQYILIPIVAIGAPFLIDFFVFGNFFPSNISNEAWAGFLGSYIGGLCTLIALIITIEDNNKKMAAQKEEQNQKEKEQRRMSVRPFIETRYTYFDQRVDFNVNDRIFNIENSVVNTVQFSLSQSARKRIEINNKYDSRMMFIKYIIRNIGAGSAVDMCITVNNFPEKIAIAQNETVQMLFIINVQEDNVNLNIELSFGDMEGRGHYIKKDCIHIFTDSDNELVSKMIECGDQVLVTG